VPDLCVQYNVGPSLKMNQANQDTMIPMSLKGLVGRPVRATVIPRSATSGGKKLTSQFGPRLILARVKVHIVEQPGVSNEGFDWSTNGMAAYLARVNALVDAWTTGLEAQLNSSFTLSWTESGGGAKSLTCTYGYEGSHFEMASEGDNAMIHPEYTFGLVAETG